MTPTDSGAGLGPDAGRGREGGGPEVEGPKLDGPVINNWHGCEQVPIYVITD